MIKRVFSPLVKLMVLLILVMATAGFSWRRQVTVVDGANSKTIVAATDDAQEALTRAGIKLGVADTITISGPKGPRQQLRQGSIITINRRQGVTLIKQGHKQVVATAGGTVEEILKEAGISRRHLVTYPHLDAKVPNNGTIYLFPREDAVEYKEQVLEPKTEYVEDPQLPQGVEKLVQQGQQGVEEIVYHREGDRLVEIDRVVVQPYVAAIIKKGTAPSVLTEQGYKKYSRKFVAHTSAYVATGNPTALGIWPHVGIIAVDPRVIPFYTKIYVPGYGIGMAGDTGGMIVDNCLDLFFDDYGAAIRWGRRNIECYILAE